MSPALTIQQSRGRPSSEFYRAVHRIADRMEPAAAAAFLNAITRLQARIDQAALRSAVASGHLGSIESALGLHELDGLLATSGMTDVLQRTSTGAGQATAGIVSEATGLEFGFNDIDPNVVLRARQQGARLVVRVAEETREAIRLIVAAGSRFGLTVDEQAVAIAEIVGLPKPWVEAPGNFANELRAGRLNRGRLLHDPTLPPRQRRAMQRRVEREIEGRLAVGELSDEFIAKHRKAYSRNLLRRRGANIARTETMDAANFGQRQAWRQAVDAGVLPSTVRRVVVVTPDERLRETHAAVPGLNSDGVGIDEPFATPWGPLVGPPWAADPFLCRCSEALLIPGLSGVL